MYTISALQDIFNAEIEKESNRLISSGPNNLYAPVKYALSMGGKRIRPVMVLLSYNLFANDVENALPAALAIEIFHNFTLLHDDIMDAAEMRRNKPTVHAEFNNNAAILSGDAMSFISFQYLLKSKSEKLIDVIRLFADTAVEVCEGQQYDMDFEQRVDVSEAEYMGMIRLKTAALLGCSLKAGALLANASDKISDELYRFGIALGIAFQLQDDLLDTFGDEEAFGKKIGGDIVSNKKTYLLIKAFELAGQAQKKELLYWVGRKKFDRGEKVTAVKKVFAGLKVEEKTLGMVEAYFQSAISCLKSLGIDEGKKKQLLLLSQTLLKRNR
ncbi:Geranylgeranyl diphosphate synthase [hydrothermal vent metagenome]|uniref:Geranylgeranyl diphosphate synthase n=1 Tax=hydrothermal vent metagenome TaxID=652676 RepID=A0A3B0UWS4_9ZZZZ